MQFIVYSGSGTHQNYFLKGLYVCVCVGEGGGGVYFKEPFVRSVPFKAFIDYQYYIDTWLI